MKRIFLAALFSLVGLVSIDPAYGGSSLPLVIQNGQTRQLPAGTTLVVQPSTTSNSSINMPQGTAPSSPNDGDFWTTSTGVYTHINGANWSLPLQTNVLTFGADPSGVSDSSTAFVSAIAAAGSGGTVFVPLGTYLLNTNPAPGFPDVNFSIATGTLWTGNGAGASGLGAYGFPPFAHSYTNPYNTTSGNMSYCSGLVVPSAPNGNVTQCWAQEILSPATGSPHQVLGYLGADDNNNVTNNTWQEIFNLVQNVHKADLIGASSSRVPLEIDLNVDVSTPGASIASDVGLTGVLVTGGGAGGSNQPGLNGTAFSVQRSTGAWYRGLRAWNNQDGVETNAYRHGILIDTTYRGNSTDPSCPSGTYPSGCTIQNGVYMDNAPYYSGTSVALGQLANGNDAVVIGRATDTAPTGNFEIYKNKANTVTIYKVASNGQITSTCDPTCNAQIFLNAPSGQQSIVQLGYNGSFTGSFGASSTQSSYIFDNINGATPFSVSNGGSITIGEINKGIVSNTFFRPQLTTVGNLATADPSPQVGDMISVSDSTACTANSTVTGGGTTTCPLVYSGTAWKAIVTH